MSLYPELKKHQRKDRCGLSARLSGKIKLSRSFALAGGLLLASISQAADAKSTEQKFAKLSDKASQALLLDVTRTAESPRLVTVGDRGHILFSDDSGKSWSQAKVPTTQMLTAVHFPSESIGYAVGHDAVILKTSDGGESWARVYDDLEMEAPLLDVWFDNENTGIALGAYGYIIRTTDGGKTWNDISHTINNEEEFHYNAIASDGGDNVYIAGEAGIVFHSPDRGKTWKNLESPYDGSLFGITASQDEVFIHGLRGTIFRSGDQGKTWKIMETGSDETLFGSVKLDSGNNVFVGNSGSVLSGKEGSWSAVNRSDRVSLSSLAAGADGSIVVVGQGGVHRMSPRGEVLTDNSKATK